MWILKGMRMKPAVVRDNMLLPLTLTVAMSTLGQMSCEELCHVFVFILLIRELRHSETQSLAQSLS